jgi:serine/threonine protein kinase
VPEDSGGSVGRKGDLNSLRDLACRGLAKNPDHRPTPVEILTDPKPPAGREPVPQSETSPTPAPNTLAASLRVERRRDARPVTSVWPVCLVASGPVACRSGS